MIDPKELRIGNWIKSIAQGDIQVKANDIADIEKIETVFLKGQDYFQPIPLTPEWLERLGFEKINHITNGIIYKKSRLIVYESLSYVEWRGGPIGRERVQYVHSLQNLFFALTGEEL